MEEGEEDRLQLGSSIELTGFRAIGGGEMVVVKKIVGNYVRRMESMCHQFGGFKIRLKPLHQAGDKLKKFELRAQAIDGGNVYPAEVVEHNLFVGIDAVCKKLMHEIESKAVK